MSQRSSVGSGRGDHGSQRVAGGSQRSYASGQPGSSASASQRGAPGTLPVGKVEGRLYKHPEDPTLSRDVLRLEDEYEKSPNLGGLSLSSGQFPSRPGFGTRGEKDIIWTNYYRLLVDHRLVFYQYNIDIQPAAVGRKRARIIELFLQRPESIAMSERICSDFKSTLLSRALLDDDFVACNIVYRSEFETQPGPRSTAYHLRLQHTKTLPVRHFLESLTTTNLSTAFIEKDTLIQAFNIFLNHYAKAHGNLVTMGSKTFPKDAVGRDLGGGLMALRGFFSSVRAATGRILVNVNVCCSAFYRPGPLVRLIKASGLQDRYQLEQFLRGARVKTSHNGVPRIRTIIALASPRDGQHSTQPRPKVPEFGAGPDRVQFWLPEQQRYVSVSEFFHRSYSIRVNKELPVVNVGSKANPVYLPPEVCEVMAGQRAGVRLSADQTSRMMDYAIQRPPPARNALSIAQEGRSMVGLSRQSNHLLNHFGVNIDGNLLSIPARILPKPRVAYGNRRFAAVNPSAAWNLRGQVMTRPASIPASTWGWLSITMAEYRPSFQGIAPLQVALESFRRSLQGTGINIGKPSAGSRQLKLRDVEDSELEEVLTGAAKSLKLLYIILPIKHTALYNRIKQLCDVKIGIINICSVEAKLVESNGRPQYFGNVALKVNLKGGGQNQSVEPSRLHFISRGDTMIVGVDVTHPSPNSNSDAPSVAASVANVHSNMAQWLATSYIQMTARQEMVGGLGNMFKRHLGLWKSVGHHNMFPQNILEFRDGVSEGQYQAVIDYELPLIRHACEEIYDAAGQQRPRITIVIVTKRHHTRFGPTTENKADGNGNCPAGTITDRGVTESHQWDFWIQAHSAIQGHARPAHYFVVHDEIFRFAPLAKDFTVADTLEDVTQSLHYVFGRCTRAVSYCTPAYYADLVCNRTRCYLSNLFDPSTHSDAASMMSGVESEEDRQRRLAQLQLQLQERITPHPRVINTMYYI